jgi:hypothetical protein
MNLATQGIPIACVPSAIPLAERAAHFALAERLFKTLALARDRLPDGLAFVLPIEELASAARFIENERRCCPFMRFEIAIEPNAKAFQLKMLGPDGTREVLEAELSLEQACGCIGACE